MWCSLRGDEFSCDLQAVRPFGVGEESWEYPIAFSGIVVDFETLRDEALVSYSGLGGYKDEVADAELDVVDRSSRLTLESSLGAF